jgi:hypothetical protein
MVVENGNKKKKNSRVAKKEDHGWVTSSLHQQMTQKKYQILMQVLMYSKLQWLLSETKSNKSWLLRTKKWHFSWHN